MKNRVVGASAGLYGGLGVSAGPEVAILLPVWLPRLESLILTIELWGSGPCVR